MSHVYSNQSPEPFPYEWDVREDGSMTITVSHGPLDATFDDRRGEHSDTFAGGWRPTGPDEAVNVAYDIAAERIEFEEIGGNRR